MVRKLIDLVSTQDGRTVMPPAPRDRLSPAEIDLIRQWQSQGMAP
jgi:mono/diheme cytochrome c family protein